MNVLQNLGLSETESTLYELLLKLGEVPVSTLIRESKLRRPTVYYALSSLEHKGLVTQRDIYKKIHVKPESPTRLQEIATQQAETIKQTQQSLTALLPAMALQFTHSTEKPVVQVYEGVEGLKEIYEDLLKEKKPISALLQAAEVEPELYEWLTTKFVKKRVKAKIAVKAIVASSTTSKLYIQKSSEEYRTSKQVDSKLYPFQHEIDIYGDKVAIIHYKKDEPLIGIVICHPHVACTMKAWFDLTWNHV